MSRIRVSDSHRDGDRKGCPGSSACFNPTNDKPRHVRYSFPFGTARHTLANPFPRDQFHQRRDTISTPLRIRKSCSIVPRSLRVKRNETLYAEVKILLHRVVAKFQFSPTFFRLIGDETPSFPTIPSIISRPRFPPPSRWTRVSHFSTDALPLRWLRTANENTKIRKYGNARIRGKTGRDKKELVGEKEKRRRGGERCFDNGNDGGTNAPVSYVRSIGLFS